MDWYPENKEELSSLVKKFLEKKNKKINGIIVPHAGYYYSGKIAGKAYSYVKTKRAIILAPSHYFPLSNIVMHNKNSWKTPLGEIKVIQSEFEKKDISKEHAINNQIPFLQELGVKEILPLVVGEISLEEALVIAKKIKDFDGVFIISTDLSHFLPYAEAVKKDKQTINIIENLDFKNKNKIDACVIFPLLITINLCKLKNWKPKLVEYKNSGDITGDKSSVVGYASFIF